jgi:hypothetical protein
MKGKCLFIIFEFENWRTAKPYSYLAGYLFIDKLKENFERYDILVVPTYYSSNQINKIIYYYINEFEYDEAFLWMPHININAKTTELLSNKINKLNVILIESLLYHKTQISENTELGLRLEKFLNFIPRNFKVFSLCPLTFEKLREFYKETKLILGLKFDFNFKNSKDISSLNNFSFLCTIYNKEREEFEKNICKYMSSINYHKKEIFQSGKLMREFDNNLRKLKFFDKILFSNLIFLFFLKNFLLRLRNYICNKIHRNRYLIWVDYLNLIYNNTDIIFSLPSYFGGVPGRIFEAMICNKKSIFICKNNYNFFKEIFNNSNVLVIFVAEKNEKNLEQIDRFIKMPIQNRPVSKYFEI